MQGKTSALRTRVTIGLCLTAMLSLLSVVQAGEQPMRVITICHEPADIHPWADRQGGGLDYYLLNKTAETLKLRFEYEIVPWKRCLALLKTNQVDGAFAGSFKADRLESGAYPGMPPGSTPDASKRLHTDRYVLVRRKGSTLNWDGKSIGNLQGALGVQLGYSVTDQLLGLGVAVDDGSQNGFDLLRKLAHGRLGGAALLEGEANALIRGNPELASELEIMNRPLVEKPYFLLLSHGLLANQTELAQAIWATIERLRNSPSYQAMERKALASSRAK